MVYSSLHWTQVHFPESTPVHGSGRLQFMLHSSPRSTPFHWYSCPMVHSCLRSSPLWSTVNSGSLQSRVQVIVHWISLQSIGHFSIQSTPDYGPLQSIVHFNRQSTPLKQCNIEYFEDYQFVLNSAICLAVKLQSNNLGLGNRQKSAIKCGILIIERQHNIRLFKYCFSTASFNYI